MSVQYSLAFKTLKFQLVQQFITALYRLLLTLCVAQLLVLYLSGTHQAPHERKHHLLLKLLGMSV
jgi:hypothetical protein